jgi:hypothetical protein
LPTGQDLDRDGRFGEPEDAQGYGRLAGDGGLAILSKWPIDRANAQDPTGLLWRDLNGGIPPDDITQNQHLSTTAHWIVPLKTFSERMLNLLAWHARRPFSTTPKS